MQGGFLWRRKWNKGKIEEFYEERGSKMKVSSEMEGKGKYIFCSIISLWNQQNFLSFEMGIVMNNLK